MIEYANEFPVEKMSQMLEVSTSAYYEWKNKVRMEVREFLKNCQNSLFNHQKVQ